MSGQTIFEDIASEPARFADGDLDVRFGRKLRPAKGDAARTARAALMARRWIEASGGAPFGMGMLARALVVLDARDRDIVACRRLLDEPVPVGILARRHGISDAEVRRIEFSGLATIQHWMRSYVGRRRAAARR